MAKERPGDAWDREMQELFVQHGLQTGAAGATGGNQLGHRDQVGQTFYAPSIKSSRKSASSTRRRHDLELEECRLKLRMLEVRKKLETSFSDSDSETDLESVSQPSRVSAWLQTQSPPAYRPPPERAAPGSERKYRPTSTYTNTRKRPASCASAPALVNRPTRDPPEATPRHLAPGPTPAPRHPRSHLELEPPRRTSTEARLPRPRGSHRTSLHGDEDRAPYDQRSLRSERAPAPPHHDSAETTQNASTWIEELVNSGHAQTLVPPALVQNPALAILGFGMLNQKLSVFSGDPCEWPQWSLSFKNLVHDNPALTDAQKINVLQNSLSGSVQARLYGMLWDGRDYGRALLELKRLYGLPDRIVAAWVTKVRSFQKLRNNRDIPSFCTIVSQLVHVFRGLDFTSDLHSAGLLNDLVEKLSESQRESWGAYVVRRAIARPSVLDFSHWLALKDEALRAAGVETEVTKSTFSNLRDADPGAGAADPNPGARRGRCQYCQRDHFIDKCAEFLAKSLSDRLKWFDDNRRCYKCAREGHSVRACRTRMSCSYPNCGRAHNPSLHEALHSRRSVNTASLDHVPASGSTAPPADENTSETVISVSPVDTVPPTSAFAAPGSSKVYLPIVSVTLQTLSGTSVDTYCLLDSGSQVTLIAKDLAREMGLRGTSHRLSLNHVGSASASHDSEKVSFRVSGRSSQSSILVKEAWTYEDLKLPCQVLPRGDNGEVLWPHVRCLGLPDVPGPAVKLLLGADCKEAFRQIALRSGDGGAPDCILTPLGWSLRGQGATLGAPSPFSVNLTLEEMVERFWSTDSFGARYHTEVPQSEEDRLAARTLDATTRLAEDSRYEVGMLWKNTQPSLPNNRAQAFQRFNSLRRRLGGNPALHLKYSESIQGWVDKGYARKCSPDEPRTDRDYWLPHREVVNPNKEKIRVVQDASAKCRGSCLNDHLLKGPELTSSLVGILLRLRQSDVVISADIKEMFHRVRVPELDQNSLRFLWTPSLTHPPDEYKMTVHIFGATCSPCCANYALRRCAVDNPSFSAAARHAVSSSFYMDDLVKSCSTVDEATQLALELASLLKRGGFLLTKWLSNSPEVLKSLKVHKPDAEMQTLDLDLELQPVHRTLGLRWDVKTDSIVFPSRSLSPAVTKRQILSVIMSVFDPVGFLVPFTMRPKLILQRLWAGGTPWDTEVPDDILSDWLAWAEELSGLDEVQVNRKYWPAGVEHSSCQLHIFADASEKAFCAVAYVRAVLTDGRVHCAMVMSKSRVSPQGSKRLTLPRLELQATVLLVRLYSTVSSELEFQFESCHFWTDSQIALACFNNDSKRFKPFVANRVAEVRSLSVPSQWRFVPGSLNPADDGTRGLTVGALSQPGHRWLNGPPFLWLPESEWPTTPVLPEILPADDEVRSVLVAMMPDSDAADSFSSDVIANFSTLHRLVRTVGWMLRFSHNVRRAKRERVCGPLSADETSHALNLIARRVQCQRFASEIYALRVKERLPASSHLIPLRPFLEDDLLRVGGRIDRALVPYDSRHQIILPTDHALTRLVIEDAHRRCGHGGTESTRSYVQQRFWVPQLKSRVKRALRECRDCRRMRSDPRVPMMSELPEARLSFDNPCWTHVGVDYFGPILVKVRRSREKRWGALFTDLTTRAVHLEIVSSLRVDSFILCFRRFLARRGPVSHMFSDNGSSFSGTTRELRTAIRSAGASDDLRDFMEAQGIVWRFLPPKASHMAGAWESLVKSVKTSLKSILRDRCVHDDTLHTTLVEIERLVNSRPLTAVSDSAADLEALSPNHFLLHHNRRLPEFCDPQPRMLDSRRRWKQSQWLTQHFWTRWRKEYLPTLCVARKWNSEQRNFQVGDVVVIVDHSAPRGAWPLGRVLEVFPSRDGRVRSMLLRTKSGTLKRPASQICLLEASAA